MPSTGGRTGRKSWRTSNRAEEGHRSGSDPARLFFAWRGKKRSARLASCLRASRRRPLQVFDEDDGVALFVVDEFVDELLGEE